MFALAQTSRRAPQTSLIQHAQTSTKENLHNTRALNSCELKRHRTPLEDLAAIHCFLSDKVAIDANRRSIVVERSRSRVELAVMLTFELDLLIQHERFGPL